MAKQATVWNPTDPNSKKVVDVGAPMEKGYQLWTGGTATGQQAIDAIKNKAASTGQTAFTQSQAPAAAGAGNITPMAGTTLPKTTGLTVGRENTAAASAVAASGYDQSLKAQGGATTTTPTVDFDSLLKGIGTTVADTNITSALDESNTYAEAEKTRLEASKNSALAALDAQYAQNLAALKKTNANQTAAIKARLIKLGISPSDSSFDNTVQGQLDRNSAAEAALLSDYNSKKIALQSDMEDKISAVTFDTIKLKNENAIAAANNLLQKQGLAKDILSIFSNREQSEKDRETQAYSDLLTYNAKMATLEQADKEALAKTFLDNAKNGMYNITDEATFSMLSRMESLYPDYLAGLTDIATTGLNDKLLTTAQKEADLEKTKADTARTKKLTAGSGSGSTSGGIKFDSDTKNALSLQGYSSTDIAQIEKDANEYGLNKVMEGLSAESQKILSSFGGKTEGIDETSVGLYISSATDEDGNLDITKIPADQRSQVISKAKELGYFDENDAETGNWLSRQWADIKSALNPLD